MVNRCIRVERATRREPRNEPYRARLARRPGAVSPDRGCRAARMAARLTYRQVRLDRLVDRWTAKGSLPPCLGWLQNEMGIAVTIDRPEIRWRASGLGRPGLVAQMTVPSLATRLAIGIETPLAHAIVDRLLGFDRPFAQSRLQLTPVEWGVWTLLFVRAISSFDTERQADDHQKPDIAANLRPGEVTLDRVGPDPFDPSGLGSIVTVRWPVRIGDVAGRRGSGCQSRWLDNGRPRRRVHPLATRLRPHVPAKSLGPANRYAAHCHETWRAAGEPRPEW